MYNKFKRIHFIGVGGIGMSAIAELLLRHDYAVSGSDLAKSETTHHLESIGLKFFQGHVASNIEGADLVVHSSAVRADNPEFKTAKEKGIPVIPRAEMLAELMRLKYGIAVAGAHGKTTTTSMTALVLTHVGLDPTVVVGGRMDNFGGTNARMGSGDFMVVEADESDGSFNKLAPSIAVVTNLDREHLDHYGDMEVLKDAFIAFLNKVPFYGLTILCGDDPYLAELRPRITRRCKTYGFKEGNDYRILSYVPSPEGSVSEITALGEPLTLRLSVPGRHNVLNALAALAVADEICVPRPSILLELAKFQGVQRRFQRRGEIAGVTFVDDYAHHPTEIAATLAAARERYPASRIRVVFQPHRYSRFADLYESFATCFAGCDAVAVTDIYAAGEKPIADVSAERFAQDVRGVSARHIGKPRQAVDAVLAESTPGDVILTLGAGDLIHVYRDLF